MFFHMGLKLESLTSILYIL